MKALVLYRPNSSHARPTEDFVHDLSRFVSDRDIQLINVNSRDGSATASLYDVMTYPAVLVVRDTGELQNSWQSEPLPLVNDVLGYLRV